MKTLVLALLISFSFETLANDLNETELFYRCYSHLTSRRPVRSNALLKDVKSRKKTALEACSQLLAKASLRSNGRISLPNDKEAKSVLSTMTKLHMSFFSKPALSGVNTIYARVANDVYDEQSSALYYTKALFDSDFDVERIMTLPHDLQGIREEGSPEDAGPSSRIKKSLFTYRDYQEKVASLRKKPLARHLNFVEAGELLGVKTAKAVNLPSAAEPALSGQNLRGHLGSQGKGILASKSYILRSNSMNNPTVQYNGANSMNREWANVVLKDFLCKSLPAVRLVDGQPFKGKDASAAFRKEDGCIQCHATMDQLAAGGRGIRLVSLTLDGASASNPQLQYPYHLRNTQKDAYHWPKKTDKNYSRRPAKGVLYYRSYTGELVNKPFSNLGDLGKKILETDDYYACIAKKYYEHFTGVGVSLADIHDPFSPIKLTEVDLKHRDHVIELSQELKKTKDTSLLVKRILASDVYRSESFDIKGGR